MQPTANPYDSPLVDVEAPLAETRRPPFGSFLLVIWSLEAVGKSGLLAVLLWQGFRPFDFLALEYRAWNRLAFFLVASFLIIETIGPWIGVYFLTGRRAKTIPIERAFPRILAIAGSVTVIAALGLMLYLETAGQ